MPYLIANEVNLFKKGVEMEPVQDFGFDLKDNEIFKKIVALRSKLQFKILN